MLLDFSLFCKYSFVLLPKWSGDFALGEISAHHNRSFQTAEVHRRPSVRLSKYWISLQALDHWFWWDLVDFFGLLPLNSTYPLRTDVSRKSGQVTRFVGGKESYLSLKSTKLSVLVNIMHCPRHFANNILWACEEITNHFTFAFGKIWKCRTCKLTVH